MYGRPKTIHNSLISAGDRSLINYCVPMCVVSVDLARDMMETNFFGPLRLTQTVIPHMRERRQGTIINVCSAEFWHAHPGVSVYGATKFALEGK
jgi:short-subunit dehydrogenase